MPIHLGVQKNEIKSKYYTLNLLHSINKYFLLMFYVKFIEIVQSVAELCWRFCMQSALTNVSNLSDQGVYICQYFSAKFSESM